MIFEVHREGAVFIERAVLASAIYAAEVVDIGGTIEVLDALCDEGKPEWFSSGPLRQVFGAVRELHRAGQKADPVTIHAKLGDDSPGLVEIVTLDDGLPDWRSWRAYFDAAQEYARGRRLETIAGELIAGGVPAAEAAQAAVVKLQELDEAAVVESYEHLGHALDDVIEELLLPPDERHGGIMTGLKDVDYSIKGFHRGQFVLIAGRPSMGKSALAGQLALHNAKLDKVVLYLSVEMTMPELIRRIIAKEAGLKHGRLSEGRLTSIEQEAMARAATRICRSPLFISTAGLLDAPGVAARARKLKAEMGRLDLVIVDQLNNLTAIRDRHSPVTEMTETSNYLRALAKQLDCPLVALSQLSREPERRGADRRPQLSDLRESGSLEQDAHIVLFVYREEVYHPNDPSKKGIAEIIVRKNRGGRIGDSEVMWDGDHVCFRDLYQGEAQ